MWHFLPLIAFTHACMSCYGKITTKDVSRSMRKAFVFDGSRKKVENRNIVSRRNISIGIPLDLSIPTEMTCIEPLVENEKSSKTPNKLKIKLCYIFYD